ncbi:MAG: hypothetical protein EXS35_09145 [Pedosphaera sp.]|nr:hypothetical protein [Pedosphaera sp.]
MRISRLFLPVVMALSSARWSGAADGGFTTEVRQITTGPRHHFFGYIGHVRTIPWNQSGRFILALRTDFQERMPKPGEAAEIVLLDTQNNFAERVVERTRAWNFQQGTMLYWNPIAPETQFFFNDRDPRTHEVFAVLFDIAKGSNGQRIAEFRFSDTPVGNSGVAQNGGWFCALNYARLARLRPVTGYPGAHDWTTGVRHPTNDGIFKIAVATKEKRLLISFKQLADALRSAHPDVDEKELFINHTLWNRDDDRIYFYVRGDFDLPGKRFNIPCVMNPDGADLRPLTKFIGGHPDWDTGHRMIGATDTEQIIYDTDEQKVVGTLGSPAIIPKPGGDIALSPDARWFVNGHGERGTNFYTILRRADGAWTRTSGMNQGGYTSGDLRVDPGPLWNRHSTQLLVPGVAGDGTRQLFVITLQAKP